MCECVSSSSESAETINVNGVSVCGQCSKCFFLFFLHLQEKLEQYLFKLRIAERKGRESKVAKMHKKIDRLRRRLAGETVGSGDEGEEVKERMPLRGFAASYANITLPPGFSRNR